MHTFNSTWWISCSENCLFKKVKWKIDKEIYNLSCLSYLFWLFLNQLWAGDKDMKRCTWNSICGQLHLPTGFIAAFQRRRRSSSNREARASLPGSRGGGGTGTSAVSPLPSPDSTRTCALRPQPWTICQDYSWDGEKKREILGVRSGWSDLISN